STIPSIKGIDLVVSVGGRSFKYSYSPATNLKQIFTWDGKDAYGRTMKGTQPISVQVGYRYAAYYQYSACNPGFGNCFGVWSPGGVSIISAPDIIKTQSWQGQTGTWKRTLKDVGGMDLNVLHLYEPTSRTLQLGDGRKRRASTSDKVMKTI